MRQFAAILILMAVLLVSCADKDKAGKNSYDKGIAALDRGDTEETLKIFKSLGSDFPESPYSLLGKAMYYYYEGLTYEAINANYRVLREHPKLLPALMLNARLFLKIDRPELAYFYIALYEENGGDETLGAVMEAEALMRADKLDESERILEKSLLDFPDDPLLLLTKARNDARRAEFAKGFDNCATALSPADGNAAVLKAAGDFFRLAGLYDSAAQYYDAALEAGKDKHYFIADIIESFLSLDYLHRAKSLLDTLRFRNENSHRYYVMKSDYYTKMGKPANAMREYGMIVPRFSMLPTVMSNFATKKSQDIDNYGAEQYFEGAVQITIKDSFPNSATISLRHAFVDLLFDMDRPEIAGPNIESMLDSLTTDFKTLHAATYAYYLFGMTDKMRDVLKRAVESSRGNPSYMAAMGQLFSTMDSVIAAHELFREVLKIDKTNKTAILGEVGIAKRKLRYKEALEFLNGFDEYVSYDPDIAAEKISLYRSTGELNSALQFAERLIEIAKKDIKRYRTAAEIAEEVGDKKKVDDIYRSCLDNNPDDPDAHIMAAKYYFRDGNYSEAESIVNKALSFDSLHVDGMTLLGDINRVRGRTDSAMALYSRAIERDKSATDALGNLAMVLLERGENLDRAINYANQAILHDGGNARHRSTLGRIYYKKGQYKIARVKFWNALFLAPEDPEYNYYAGINFIKTGQPDSARVHLRKAIDIGLEGKMKSDARTALRSL
ncbi:MAG: tetratricopeptide repeat protein [Candidatus Zixiibacteriota bacterium]|nr:MAG: tetratricopeptide repeat protein [candidate division Zixibacteria bacterium]